MRIGERALGMATGLCVATTKSGNPCRLAPLEGELLCLFHSKSEKANAIRHRRRPKLVDRRQLLMRVSRCLEELSALDMPADQRIRLEAQLASRAHKLLSDIENIAELSRLVKRNER